MPCPTARRPDGPTARQPASPSDRIGSALSPPLHVREMISLNPIGKKQLGSKDY